MSNISTDELPCPHCAARSARIERTYAGPRIRCQLCDWAVPINDNVETELEEVDDVGEVDLNAALICCGCLTRNAYLRGGNGSRRIRVACDVCGHSSSLGEAEQFFRDLAAQVEHPFN